MKIDEVKSYVTLGKMAVTALVVATAWVTTIELRTQAHAEEVSLLQAEYGAVKEVTDRLDERSKAAEKERERQRDLLEQILKELRK